MNTQSQRGFIPLLVLLIALLGGGVAAYEVHKHNQEGKGEQQVQGETRDEQESRNTEKDSEQQNNAQSSTTPKPTLGVKGSTGADTWENNTRDREDNEQEGEDDGEDGDDGRGSTSTTPTSTPAPKPTSTPTTVYTLAQIKTHATRTSCWTAVYGNVYDVTTWISQHPGGSGAILSMCGTDGTSSFDAQHGGQSRANAELGSFKIGVLK